MGSKGPAPDDRVSLTIADDRILTTGRPTSGVRLWWLGQAGFLLRDPEATVLIDPYLSDSLALKYRGREFPHVRMMPPPVLPDELQDLTHVLCTHGHTDHLDPGTLPRIAAASPGACFVVPRSIIGLAIERGVPEGRLVSFDAGEAQEVVRPGAAASYSAAVEPHLTAPSRLQLHAVPSAHEEIETDADGRHLYLGYVFRLGGTTFYHSGDTVPYPGLAERLRMLGIDVALLPINGRDEYRRTRGVPGNLTVGEAQELALAAGARYLVCHHWGMFDFNTVDPEEARHELARIEHAAESEGEPGIHAFLPETGKCYHWTAAGPGCIGLRVRYPPHPLDHGSGVFRSGTATGTHNAGAIFHGPLGVVCKSIWPEVIDHGLAVQPWQSCIGFTPQQRPRSHFGHEEQHPLNLVRSDAAICPDDVGAPVQSSLNELCHGRAHHRSQVRINGETHRDRKVRVFPNRGNGCPGFLQRAHRLHDDNVSPRFGQRGHLLSVDVLRLVLGKFTKGGQQPAGGAN